MHVNYSFLAALVLLTIIKCGYMESKKKIWVTYFNNIHLATKYITLFNIVKHSMKVFTSNNKLTSICVNCSRNNSRPCFININSHIPWMLMSCCRMLCLSVNNLYILYMYRKPTVTWDPMENKTYCNLGLWIFSSNCIPSKLQNYCIHINDEYVNITYVHT